jgi:hypothetical protein
MNLKKILEEFFKDNCPIVKGYLYEYPLTILQVSVKYPSSILQGVVIG